MTAAIFNWASVATPNTVFVGIVGREEFDQIALPARDMALILPDRPVLVKTAQMPDGFQVIFQHWYGPTPAAAAATRAANAALEDMRATAKKGVDA